jgi:predicted amidophosphoribosyltransferase
MSAKQASPDPVCADCGSDLDELGQCRRQCQLGTAPTTGMSVGFTILLRAGAICSKCGHGTRATSGRWARCKKCGARVQRTPKSEACR